MEMAVVVFYIGIIIIAAILTQTFLSRLKLPAIVGYITIGVILRAFDWRYSILPAQGEEIIHFLAELGVIVLLFHIGLKSKLKKLLRQIKRASFIGLVSLIVSAAAGFAGAYMLLGLSFFTSLIIAAAMVATSVGVSAGVWEENKVIQTEQGQLLMDMTELNDIGGVIIMALLFAVAPAFTSQSHSAIGTQLSRISIIFAVKFIGFAAGCFLFSRYAEKPLRSFFDSLEKPPEETLTIIATGFIIAAVAALLGFSVAIGAFFAGLIFSRDPASIKAKTAANVVYDLFMPFFFIGIGLNIQPSSFTTSLGPMVVLTTAAFFGMFVGTFGPALLSFGSKDSIIIGISMIPRAEVTMIIMQRSLAFKADAMPEHIYSAMVITCIITCTIPPLILNRLIGEYTRGRAKQESK